MKFDSHLQYLVQSRAVVRIPLVLLPPCCLFSFCYSVMYSTRPFCSTLAWAFRNSTDLVKSQPLFVPDITKLNPDREAAAKTEYRITSLQTFPRGGFSLFGGCHSMLEDHLLALHTDPCWAKQAILSRQRGKGERVKGADSRRI